VYCARYLWALQVVFVARKGTGEGSSTSRQGGTIQLLRERLEKAAHFPLLVIAPEVGGCTRFEFT
jgi:hypothetical protein